MSKTPIPRSTVNDSLSRLAKIGDFLASQVVTAQKRTKASVEIFLHVVDIKGKEKYVHRREMCGILCISF